MADSKNGQLVLRVTVLKGRNLAAKDKNGFSDPFMVFTLGDVRQATPVIPKTLNPEWNETFDLPVAGTHSLLLQAVCWDKDRFGKDYMGEFDIPLEDIFSNGQVTPEAQWHSLTSKKSGKKECVVSGEVQLQFTILDPNNSSASPQQLLQKLGGIVQSSPGLGDEDEDGLERADSGDLEDDDEVSGEGPEGDDPKKVEQKKKRLRLARLRKKATDRAYELGSSGDIAGVLFLEITKIKDLPPERNVTRTSFDCDPFVVTSLGRKTYRTRVIRHNLNPVFEEKLVFQVLKNEVNYSLNFAVVDRDKLSGNDFIGTTDFSLAEIISAAPVADPSTGLYRLPELQEGSAPPTTDGRKSRFRLPLSRTSSAQSLSRLTKPSLKKEASSSSISNTLHPDAVQPPALTGYPQTLSPEAPALSATISAPTSAPMPNPEPEVSDDPDLRSYDLNLSLRNKEKWEGQHNPVLYIRAKYLPYKALRQQFWKAMLKQYDADESGRVDKVELTTMLDNLGSTLHESTIDSFFKRFPNEDGTDETTLSFDQAVICLEDQLQKTQQTSLVDKIKGLIPGTTSSSTTAIESSTTSIGGPVSSESSGTPGESRTDLSHVSTMEQPQLGKAGEEGQHLNGNDLSDERGEEHVIEIRECPICHQPRLNKKSDADIITHVATCASQDWRQVNNIVMAGFVTSSQAQRKWYSKVINKVSYGGYKLGANSANILVQDRITGQISEEKMSVYVRMGIRLLYKGFKSKDMETKRIRKLLKSLSIKQGRKFDDPASKAEIAGFINFHKLDMSEVLLPTDQFKNFNEFFYRALKPDARPCSAPDRPEVVTSPADCRSVLFNKLDTAQTIWVKGREFSVERLLGNAYPEDVKRFQNGALGIFRLAPQDYHRFHIPVDGVMCEPKLIEGEYYTVNPMAIRSALDVYGENIRVLVPIDSTHHGRVMVVCVGAMMVGSTVITRNPGDHVKRAEELGYFKFGGSTILLLFEPGQIVWDDDIVENSKGALETLIRVGMSVGHSPHVSAHKGDMLREGYKPTTEEMQDAKRRIEGAGAGGAAPMSA